MDRRLLASCGIVASTLIAWSSHASTQEPVIGSESALPSHLLNGAEFKLQFGELLEHGRKVFIANWTDQDGAGRPLTDGTGAHLANPMQRLDGLRAMNRVSGPDSNSCAGCHNMPHAIVGGSGDFASIVFQMAQRFDFVTFDRSDTMKTRGSLDESGRPATLQTVGNARATPDVLGAGYLEMLARQITADLQQIRDSLEPGKSKPLVSTGISFGRLSRYADGRWNTRAVEGLPPQSLQSRSAGDKPTLAVHPWMASGSAVSLRELNNGALNQHFGMQSTERFGVGTDPDGDGVTNEVTRGDVTALNMFVATLQVPARVIPADSRAERRVADGERTFARIGCATCHIPSLPLRRTGWKYSEPGPYNPAGNVQRDASSRLLEIDLSDPRLPQPRLPRRGDTIPVPAFTDFKLHDITDAADREAAEPLDINQPTSSPKFLQGNRRFLTRRLWGLANTPPYYHHGLFTSIDEAIVAHAGEARAAREQFQQLPAGDKEALLTFLQTLQVLPPGVTNAAADRQQ